VAGDGKRADRPHADRVPVGLGLRGQVEADGQRAAWTVVDHDLLAKLLAELGAEDARDRVGGAAGGLRDDEPDRLVRVLCRRAGGERARKQQQGHSKRAHIAFLYMRF
jgi:hypothetical protein